MHRITLLIAALPLLSACTQVRDLVGADEELKSRVETLEEENARLADENASLAERATRVPATPPPPRAVQDTRVEVEDNARETIVRVPADLFFRSGQHALTDGAASILDEIATLIKKGHSTGAVRIEGHADTDPIKKSGNHCNFELAYKRAHTVMHTLAEKGVPLSRMEVVSHGEHKPHDPANKAKNRRVEIVIVK